MVAVIDEALMKTGMRIEREISAQSSVCTINATRGDYIADLALARMKLAPVAMKRDGM